MATSVPSAAPDGGYGWVVLGVSFILCALLSSSIAGYGVYFVEYVEYFNVPKAEAALISAIGIGTVGFLAVLFSNLVGLCGIRKMTLCGPLLISGGLFTSAFAESLYPLYFTHGLVHGTGICCALIGTNVALFQYFNKRRGLALGLYTVGASLGAFASPILNEYLVRTYSWRGAVIIFSGIQLQGVVLAALLRPLPVACAPAAEEDRKVESFCKKALNTAKSTLNLLRGSKVLLCVLSAFFIMTGHNVPYTFLIARAVELGMSKSSASFLASSLGIASSITRPINGYLADRLKQRRALFVALATVVSGICELCISFCTIPVYMYFPVVLFGLANSSYLALLVVILGDLLPSEKLSSAAGFFYCVTGFSTILCLLLGGLAADKTGSFATTFQIFGSLQSFGGLLLLIVYILQRRSRNNLVGVPPVDEEIVVIPASR